ncbi:hypothetical protein EYF80_017519 [Liparis tanakae]|uniref:Uncharacterized protein n=1 Tax=Liparis tanakae TaxID=230148 RepID=A0A4Z2I450_9TELE|nr:hypothetical protein EYF80_017519 [Liparis tanakae]
MEHRRDERLFATGSELGRIGESGMTPSSWSEDEGCWGSKLIKNKKRSAFAHRRLGAGVHADPLITCPAGRIHRTVPGRRPDGGQLVNRPHRTGRQTAGQLCSAVTRVPTTSRDNPGSTQTLLGGKHPAKTHR